MDIVERLEKMLSMIEQSSEQNLIAPEMEKVLVSIQELYFDHKCDQLVDQAYPTTPKWYDEIDWDSDQSDVLAE